MSAIATLNGPTRSPASRARARCTSGFDGARSADVKLRIYEPPRFFEAFLRGRAFTEVPDITARICGICPVAYQMSAVRAMEDACGVAIDDGPIRDLRRLLYCGEWIESHTLHVYMLHAPDFLGYDERDRDGARPPRDRRARPADEEGGQRADGGGRRPRGPSDQRARRRLLPRADAGRAAAGGRAARARARDRARDGALDRRRSRSPTSSVDPELVALRDAGEYPIDRGRIVSTAGLDIAPSGVRRHVVEEHVEHSNALHARLRERGSYLTGPLARYTLAFDALSPAGARGGAATPGSGPCAATRSRASSCAPSSARTRATRRCASSRPTSRPTRRPSRSTPRRGVGYGASEAPRGML